MSTMRWIFAALVGLTLSLGAVAQAPDSAPPASSDEPAPEDASEAQPPAADEDRTLEEIFIPSEEIAADEEITFPINI